MPEQKRKYKLADFVSKIVKDPNSPPNTLLLQGYLGDSSDEGHIRLYLDPQLSDYVEIPEDAILHTQEIPNATLGETYVWINQDAELTHGKAGPQRLKAKFLEGRLQQQYLGGAAEAQRPVAPVPTPPVTLFPQQCLPHTIGIACIPSLLPTHCQTHAPLLCPVSIPIFHCQPSIATPCISHNVVCPTKNPVQCPPASGGFGCGQQGPGPEQFAADAMVQHPTLLPNLCPQAMVQHPTLVPNLCPIVHPPTQLQHFCPSVVVLCASAVDACVSRLCPSQVVAQCPSAVDACPSRLCPSVPALQCPSRIIEQCPSAVDACPSRICLSVVGCPPSVPVNTCPSAGFVFCHTQVCEVASAVCPPPQSVPVYTCPSVSPIATCQSIDPRTCVRFPG